MFYYIKENQLLPFPSAIGLKSVPYIIENSSPSQSERLMKLLRRIDNSGDSTKENKDKILKLLRSKISFPNIVSKTGFTKIELLNNYTYSNSIPAEYINENTTQKTMNWIANLSISEDVRAFLFERAGMNKGNPKRLTQDSMKIIKKFFKREPRFFYLTISQQKHILTCSINFKGEVIDWLRSIVTEYSKPQKIV